MERRRPVTIYVGLIAFAALAAAVVWGRTAAEWAFAQELLVARATGWCAAVALCAALLITPIARLFEARRAALGRLRRALGIGAALCAAAHAALALAGPLDGAWDAVVSWPYLRAGLVALFILLALLVTSFPRLTRALRVRVWKPLHRLSYAAAALVVLHLYSGPFAPRRAVLVYASVIGIALAVRLVPRRRRAPEKRSTPAPR